MALPVVAAAGLPDFPALLDVNNKPTIPRVHECLNGIGSFNYYPTTLGVVKYTPMVNRTILPEEPSLFVENMPPLLPLEAIAWMVDTVLRNYRCSGVERNQETGRVKVSLSDRKDVERLQRFSRGIMLDLSGVWSISTTDPGSHGIQRSSIEEQFGRIRLGAVLLPPQLPQCLIEFK